MKKIIRTQYLEKLISVKGTPDIKVITGIRRCGKSVLLSDYMEYIEKNDKNANIVFVNFQEIEFDDLKEYKQLHEYILSKYIKDKNNYLFIDEVQMCNKFELAINSIHCKEIFDIYITGSNAFLMSSDLSTLFTGRTFSIDVYPFSFNEYLEFSSEDKEKGFNNYLKYGGMPGSYVYEEEKKKYEYLNDIFDTVILRDIVSKYGLRDYEVLENLSSFLIDNISNLTSTNKISSIMRSNNLSVNHVTIGNYMKYLCDAYVFYKAKRYDLKGKLYLSTSEKYYLSDHSFKYSKLGMKNLDIGRVYENIVYMELLRRGYTVYVGKLYDKEVDFVATRWGEQIYIQVSSYMEDSSVLEREIKPLLSIKDGYPKMIIARTHQDDFSHDGVIITDIVKWLSESK